MVSLDKNYKQAALIMSENNNVERKGGKKGREERIRKDNFTRETIISSVDRGLRGKLIESRWYRGVTAKVKLRDAGFSAVSGLFSNSLSLIAREESLERKRKIHA